MTSISKASFSFTDFFINKSVFNFKDTYKTIDVTITPSGKIFMSSNKFELLLDVRIKEEEGSDEVIQVLCTAIFELMIKLKIRIQYQIIF